jgi:hypothetical protein
LDIAKYVFQAHGTDAGGHTHHWPRTGEIAAGAAPDGRVRRVEAGRRPLEAADPRLIEDLERIVTPTQRGDPEQPLRWTIKSLRQIARALHDLGHGISHTSVGAVLRACGYSQRQHNPLRFPLASAVVVEIGR